MPAIATIALRQEQSWHKYRIKDASRGAEVQNSGSSVITVGESKRYPDFAPRPLCALCVLCGSKEFWFTAENAESAEDRGSISDSLRLGDLKFGKSSGLGYGAVQLSDPTAAKIGLCALLLLESHASDREDTKFCTCDPHPILTPESQVSYLSHHGAVPLCSTTILPGFYSKRETSCSKRDFSHFSFYFSQPAAVRHAAMRNRVNWTMLNGKNHKVRLPVWNRVIVGFRSAKDRRSGPRW
jgi:hypothetical protein